MLHPDLQQLKEQRDTLLPPLSKTGAENLPNKWLPRDLRDKMDLVKEQER